MREHGHDPLGEVRSAIEVGEYASASAQLERIPLESLSPSHQGRAIAMNFVCLDCLEEHDRAVSFLNSMVQEKRGNFSLLLAAGVELSDRAFYVFAERVLKDLCTFDPNNHIPWYNLALVQERDGCLDTAILTYDESLRCCPSFAPSMERKAACLREIGQLESSVQCYTRYLELQPDDAPGWVGLAIAYSDLEQYEEADRAYRSARRLDADSADLFFNWMVTSSRQKNLTAIGECAKSLRRIAPEDWRTALANASLYLVSEGQTWRAWEECRRGFDLALAEGRDQAQCAAAHALAIADEGLLHDSVGDFVATIFELELFSTDILLALRELQRKRSKDASCYCVILHGVITDRELVIELARADEDGPPFRYCRGYEVWAEDDSQAAQFALDFEQRCGGSYLEIEDVEQIGQGRHDEYLGVSGRGEKRYAFSDNTPEDEN